MEFVCQNRKASFEYEVIERLECGIVLKGSEIKSVRQHHVSLDGAYALVSNDNVDLIGCNIEHYSFSRIEEYEPKRVRRLLLNRKEIRNFAEKGTLKGFTLIPMSMYFVGGRLKVELAVCRGRHMFDKRKAIRDREEKKRLKKI